MICTTAEYWITYDEDDGGIDVTSGLLVGW